MRLLAAALLVGLAGCGPSSETVQPAQHEAVAELRIEDAWAAPTPGGVEVSAGYFTAINGTAEEDALIGASSPRAARVEVHETVMQDGVMQMRPMSRAPIPAGQSLELAPGGRHLMFFDVDQPFTEGETIPVRLRFERAGELTVSLPVHRRGPEEAHDSH